MKTEITRDISYYENLPYTITIRKDEEGDFIAKVQELPGCVAHGESEASAVECLHSVQKLWLEEALASGNAIPEPEEESTLPSGKWVQRVPRRLHRDLVRLAQRDSVSLNQLVTSMLSEALTAKSCTHVLEDYLSQMRAVPSTKVFLSQNALCHFWHEPEHELNEWSTTSHALPENLWRKLDWASAIMRVPKRTQKRLVHRDDNKYIEDAVFAGE